MQHLGCCACCQDGYKRMVYVAADPQTNEIKRVCQKHEAAWAQQREAPTPEPVVDERSWRRFL